MEWDDLRIFLALTRGSNVRQAGIQAGLSHSTMTRRLARFEASLGTRLFDRSPQGLVLTSAGETLLTTAERIEDEVYHAERQLAGQEQTLRGTIRVTMVDVVASEMLMPDLRTFCDRYPDIELELLPSLSVADLARQEADIALRFTQQPDASLIGRKLATVANAGYASHEYLATHNLNDPVSASWIGIGGTERFPDWVKRSGLAHLPTRGRIESQQLQISATRTGLGVGYLPCFVGDPDPELVCVDDKANFAAHSLWLLRHPDTRETARLRAFADFITQAVLRKSALLAGT
ncbi:MAG: DNA-binding transcriptional LysR family regulator [Gammaproteobacteria bacterium]|jgi:DNA-binding transcriptional LysR family regulator